MFAYIFMIALFVLGIKVCPMITRIGRFVDWCWTTTTTHNLYFHPLTAIFPQWWSEYLLGD